MKIYIKILLVFFALFSTFCDKNKCSGYGSSFDEPLIEIINDYSSGLNPVSLPKSNIYLFTDSLSFYSTWTLGKGQYIDFNTNSCIYIDERIKSPKNIYIQNVQFSLEETSNNYILIGKFCTRRVLFNQKRSKYYHFLIKTKKLTNKPITLEFRYD